MIYKRFTEKAAEEWRQIYKVSRKYRNLPLEGHPDWSLRVFNSSSFSSKMAPNESLTMRAPTYPC